MVVAQHRITGYRPGGKQLERGKATALKAPNLPAIKIKAEDWYRIITTVRSCTNHKMPEWVCFDLYSVDPMSVVSFDAIEAWNCYQACGGFTRIATPQQYYGLPALYVAAARIIEDQLTRRAFDGTE